MFGALCLISAFLLAWFSPKGGTVDFLEVDEGYGRSALRVTKREREVIPPETSVAEQYVSKAGQGMGLKEVRWIVGDFIALKLEEEYPEEQTAKGYLGLRKKREDWYLETLVSGFGLTKEQKRQAAESMGVLREEDFAEFLEFLAGVPSFEHEGRTMKLFDGGKARKLMDAKSWLMPAYLPSSLCDLSDEQKDILRDGNPTQDPFEEGADQSMEGIALFNLYQPTFSNVFPLTEEQSRKISATSVEFESWLPQSMCLHPAQLRIHLLTEPDIAGRLWKEIEAAGE